MLRAREGVLAPRFLGVFDSNLDRFDSSSISRNVEVRILPPPCFMMKLFFYGIFFLPFGARFCFVESYEKNDEDLVIMEHLWIQ